MRGKLGRIGALSRRELLEVARGKAFFVLRSLYAGFIVALGAMGIISIAGSTRLSADRWSANDLVWIASHAFSALVWIQSLVALSLGVFLAVTSVARERRQRTLGLLVLSQLRNGEVVIGKFGALLLLLASILLAAIPVVALLGWAGGIDYVGLLELFLQSTCFSALGISVGLAVALRFRGPVTAILISLCILVGLPLSRAIYVESQGASGLSGDLWLLPVQGVRVLAEQSGKAIFWGALGADALLVLFFLFLARQWLPAAAKAVPGPGLRAFFERLDRGFERVNLGGVRFTREERDQEVTARPLRGNPVRWLSQRMVGLHRYHYRLRLLLGVAVVTFSTLALVAVKPGWATFFLSLLGIGLVILPLLAGANAFGVERRDGSLEVLLSTPLSTATLLHGKMLSALRQLAVVFVVPLLVTMLSALALDSLVDGLVKSVSMTVMLTAATGLLAYLLALNLSCYIEQPLRAASVAAVLLIACPLLVLVAGGSFAGWIEGDGAWRNWLLALLLTWLVSGTLVLRRGYKRRLGLWGLAALLILTPLVFGVVAAWTLQEGSLVSWLEAVLGADLDDWAPLLFLLPPLLVGSSLLYLYVRQTFDAAFQRAS